MRTPPELRCSRPWTQPNCARRFATCCSNSTIERIRVVTGLIERAASRNSGWASAARGLDEVVEIVAFVQAARRVGYADPRDVDEPLRRGSVAFLRKDYSAARGIFDGLLQPLAEREIDLGQHEPSLERRPARDLLGIALPVLAYRAGMLVRNLDECWNRHRPVRSRWRAPGAPIV